MSASPGRDGASFRDPSGFVFRAQDGRLYRHIAPSFAQDWDAFNESGLAEALMEARLMVRHEVVDPSTSPGAYAVIAPREIDFVSYPYEWSFSQLQDAALLTLKLQRIARKHGMSLRDASAFNITFVNGRAMLLDSLSFERRTPGAPWIAYGQFCSHFLAPLALMAYRDPRAALMLRDAVDGLPLDYVASLLPLRTRLRFGLLSHLHLHARSQRKHAAAAASSDSPVKPRQISDRASEALLDSLRGTVEGLHYKPAGTEWADYAENTSYSAEATDSKARIVAELLSDGEHRYAWDLGANTGVYSRVAADRGYRVISADIDPAAVERHYLSLRKAKVFGILPLVQDLTNPSPAVGWDLAERRSIIERANASVVLALALIHHLAIGKNIPLPMTATFFARLAPELIIEFVPKSDPMVERLLATREDIFPDYTLEGFRAAYAEAFEIVAERPVADSDRVLFLLRRR